MLSRLLYEIFSGLEDPLPAISNSPLSPLKYKFSPVMSAKNFALRTLTLNCALLPGIHAHVEERVRAIAETIASYDIVILQVCLM